METFYNIQVECPICGKYLKVIENIRKGYDTDNCGRKTYVTRCYIDFEIQKCPDCSNKLSLLEERIELLEGICNSLLPSS